MYVCVVNQQGDMLLRQNINADAKKFLALVDPYRHDLVVAVECTFTWYWLADLCAKENIHFILGHALYMKAIHGGKAKNDRIDSRKIALLAKGGLMPQAYVYPARMRATRDLLRRRMYLARYRADLLAHIQNTVSQHNLPPLGIRADRKAQRPQSPEHFPNAVVHR